jgi:hypothetical protein
MPQYSVEDEATFNANQIFNRGFGRVVLLFQETEFARSQERVFRKKFKGTVVESLTYNKPEVLELRPTLMRLKRLEYDAIFIPHVEPLLLGVLKEMKQLGISGKQVFSIFSAQMPEVLSINEDAADGFIYSYPDIPLNLDAIEYFPKLGAEMLSQALSACGGKFDCVTSYLETHCKFSEAGVLERPIVLRTVRRGKFTLLDGGV